MVDGDAVEAEQPADTLEQVRDRAGARELGEGLRLGAIAGTVCSAACGERDEGADHGGDRQEDEEGEQVLALGDRERVDRRGEVPVDEQEADHRRGEGRPDATDGRHADDEEQEEEQHARQAEVVAQVRQYPRQHGERDRREEESEQDAAARQGARAPTTPAARGRRAVVDPADHVDVEPEPEPAITRLITDPRVSSVKRERRVAPSTIWVALRLCAVETSVSPMSAPTTSR